MGELSKALEGMSVPDKAKALVAEADALLAKRFEQAQYIEHLESEIARLRKEKGISGAQDNLSFDERTGTWIEGGTNLRYCAKCLAGDKRQPLKDHGHGWTCMVCGSRPHDPARPYPAIESDYNPFP